MFVFHRRILAESLWLCTPRRKRRENTRINNVNLSHKNAFFSAFLMLKAHRQVPRGWELFFFIRKTISGKTKIDRIHYDMIIIYRNARCYELKIIFTALNWSVWRRTFTATSRAWLEHIFQAAVLNDTKKERKKCNEKSRHKIYLNY